MSKHVNIDFILNETDEFTYENCVLHSLSGNSAPSIDIVHCGECKYYNGKYCFNSDVTLPTAPSADDFCSYGERKSDE